MHYWLRRETIKAWKFKSDFKLPRENICCNIDNPAVVIGFVFYYLFKFLLYGSCPRKHEDLIRFEKFSSQDLEGSGDRDICDAH